MGEVIDGAIFSWLFHMSRVRVAARKARAARGTLFDDHVVIELGEKVDAWLPCTDKPPPPPD